MFALVVVAPEQLRSVRRRLGERDDWKKLRSRDRANLPTFGQMKRPRLVVRHQSSCGLSAEARRA